MIDEINAPQEPRLTQPKRNFSLRLGSFVALVALVLVAVGAIYLLRNNSSDTGLEVADYDTAGVLITDSGFFPATIKVKSNTIVTWQNADAAGHSVSTTAGDLEGKVAGLNSGESIGPNDSFSFTFENPGTYEYYDPADASVFKGTVIVE